MTDAAELTPHPQTSALLLGLFVLLAGNGLLGLVLPLAASERFEPVVVGAMGAGYFAGFLVGCLVLGRVVARVGHIRVFAALAAIAAAAALGHLLIGHAAAWVALRLATGLAFAGIYMVAESWINEAAGDGARGRLLTRYRLADLGGLTVGMALAALPAPSGHESVILAAALIALGLAPVTLGAGRQPPPIPDVGLALGDVWRASPLAFGAAFAVGLANGPIWALAPGYAAAIGAATPGDAALLVGAIVVGGALVQIPIGRLSDRFDRRRVLVGCCAAAAAAGLAMAGLQDLAPAWALAALWGGFAFPLYALGIAHANDRAARDRFVAVAGTLLLLYAVGAAAGPLAAAALMDRFGPQALFLWTAGVHAGLTLFGLARMAVRPPTPAAEQEPFVAAPRTSPAVFALDPRAPDEPPPADGAPAAAPLSA